MENTQRINTTCNDNSKIVREKLGEIFQVSKQSYAFVCIHCSREYQHFTEFIIHTEQHLFETIESSKDFQQRVIKVEMDETTIEESSSEGITVNCDTINISYKHEDEVSLDSFMDENEYNDSDRDYFNETNTEMNDNFAQFAGDRVENRGDIHLYPIENVVRYLCPLCDKTFASLGSTQKHTRMHHGARYSRDMIRKAQINNVACDANNRISDTRRLKQSMEMFSCPLCDSMYSVIGSLQKHLKKKHDKMYTCDSIRRAQKTFTQPNVEGKWICPITMCEQSFTLLGNVQKHVRIRHKQKLSCSMIREAQRNSQKRATLVNY